MNIEEIKKQPKIGEIEVAYLPNQKLNFKKSIYNIKARKWILLLVLSIITLITLVVISFFKSYFFIYTSIPGTLILLSILLIFYINEKSKRITNKYIPDNNVYRKRLTFYTNQLIIITDINSNLETIEVFDSIEKISKNNIIILNLKKKELYIPYKKEIFDILKNEKFLNK